MRIQAATARQLLPRAERAESILRGAAEAFARAGFADTSMEDVAGAVGVTKLILYRHFGSKEDLYRAVLSRVSDRLAEEFVGHLGERGVSVRALLTVAREDPAGFTLLWRHAATEPAFSGYALEQRRRSVEVARALMEDRLDDPTLDAWAPEALVGWVVEAVLAWLERGDPARDDEAVERIGRAARALRTSLLRG